MSQTAAGYSTRPLWQKLGLRGGMRLVTLGAPRGYAKLLAPLPTGVVIRQRLVADADVIHCFVTWRRDLEKHLRGIRHALRDDAPLWVSWPKRSSGQPTDLTGDVLREVILPTGLVDVKVCAVNHTWSGLKFVRRLRHRR